MGLIRGMARTAVVACTATTVSNLVSRRQAGRWQQQEYEQEAQYAAAPPPPSVPAAPAGGSGMTAELERLASLRNQGVLTDEEFASAKAKLLGI